MSLISRLYDFVSQTRIRSVEVDNEFNQLVNSHNLHDGRIDSLEDKDILLQGDIDLANSNADSAVATANTANTTANTANGKADSAVATANTANGKADSAVVTANNASANATTALNKATQVETDYNAIVPVINQAVADAEQAVADVADKASVAYVDQVASNFAMGIITDGSLLRQKLAPAVIDELDGLRADIDLNTTALDNLTVELSDLAQTVNDNMISIGTSTISTTGWVAHTGDNALKLDLAISGVVSTDWVDVIVDKEFQDVAQDSEINQTVNEYDGGITIYANTAPSVAIPIRYKVVK